MNTFRDYLVIAVFYGLLSSTTHSKEKTDQHIIASEPYTQKLANFTIVDGSRFKLCQDFNDYLNRQTPFYYFLELKPDPLFSEFKLPHLITADKDYGLAIVKERIDSVFKEDLEKVSDKQKKIELIKKHERDWLNSDYLNYEVTYYKSRMDINHSGKKDDVLIVKTEYPLTGRNKAFKRVPIGINASLFNYVSLDKDGSYKHIKGFSLGGHPFYYRGRFYVARLGYTSLYGRTTLRTTIHEPKVAFQTKEGVYEGRAVCQLSMTPTDRNNKK